MQDTASPESLGLPPADQIGFVVRNPEQAMARYAPLFGPFDTIDGSVQDADYRGTRADVSLRIAFGRSGEIEIELLQMPLGGPGSGA